MPNQIVKFHVEIFLLTTARKELHRESRFGRVCFLHLTTANISIYGDELNRRTQLPKLWIRNNRSRKEWNWKRQKCVVLWWIPISLVPLQKIGLQLRLYPVLVALNSDRLLSETPKIIGSDLGVRLCLITVVRQQKLKCLPVKHVQVQGTNEFENLKWRTKNLMYTSTYSIDTYRLIAMID